MKLNYIGSDKSAETQFKAIQIESEDKDKQLNNIENKMIDYRTDIDNKLTGIKTSNDGNIIVFDGTSGKIAKDGGYTITDILAAVSPLFINLTANEKVSYIMGFLSVVGLELTLSASSVYEIEMVLQLGTTNETNGIRVAIGYSGMGTVSAFVSGPLSNTANTTLNALITAFSTASSTMLVVANMKGGVLIKGVITTTTGGNLTAMVQKMIAGYATIYAGSYIRARKII